ncbi:MAG: hypothetical protein ACI9J4_001041 [Paraglaciecola sp.]|jgi:hypothetical protein
MQRIAFDLGTYLKNKDFNNEQICTDGFIYMGNTTGK